MKMKQVPCISGPILKDLSVFSYGQYWDYLSLYGYMEHIEIQNHSRRKAWDSGKDHWSLFAAELLCNWKFCKQSNGNCYKKYMSTPCIEILEGFYFGWISDSTYIFLNSKYQCITYMWSLKVIGVKVQLVSCLKSFNHKVPKLTLTLDSATQNAFYSHYPQLACEIGKWLGYTCSPYCVQIFYTQKTKVDLDLFTPWPKINRVSPLIMHNWYVTYESDWTKAAVYMILPRDPRMTLTFVQMTPK